jgi:hypothetical protein
MTGVHRMVDPSEIQFGTLALEKGFITPNQLGKAVTLQMKADLENDIHRLLGEILVELGFMTLLQVDEVLRVGKGINQA